MPVLSDAAVLVHYCRWNIVIFEINSFENRNV